MGSMLQLILLICVNLCIINAILTSDHGGILTIINTTYEVSTALFGYESYKGSITGLLILPANETYHTECPGATSESLGTNPYIQYINTWFGGPSDITDYIIIIDRGDCAFVDKVYHAQNMGASGVIICDTRNEALFDMWLAENYAHNITIPSVLLQKSNCESIMNQLDVQNWDPVNPATMTYPSASNLYWTIGEIHWGLPRTDNKVTLDVWTSSNDLEGAEFIYNFTEIAEALEEENSAIFTPHLYILNGTHWACDRVPQLPCARQCSNNGRYCAVDPEYQVSIGLDGIDIIQENLRSLCIRQYFINNQLEYMLWWNYTMLWNENCGYTISIQNFTANCSFAQMNTLDTTKTLSEFVTNCIVSSGNYGYTDGVNTFLESETKLREDLSILYSLPMVKVNKFVFYSASTHCPIPVTTATCEILRVICGSFINGTEPAICFSETSCDISQRDCTGTCLGSFQINPCGICISSTRSDFSTFGMDCSGTCNGGKQFDQCGNCLSQSDSGWNNCVGCDGIPFSGKQFNECGLCIMANDPNFDNHGKDCRNICASTSSDTYYLDRCGQCLLSTDPEWDSCLQSSTTTEPTTILNSTMTTSNTGSSTATESTTISNSTVTTSNTGDTGSSTATESTTVSNSTMITDTVVSSTESAAATTNISQTENQCPMSCLYYFDGCNWCWCSDLGNFSSCSNKQCNHTIISQPYCDECRKERQKCDDGTFVDRLLEKYCEFDECSDDSDSIDILSNDTKCQYYLGALFSFYCILVWLIE